MHRPNPYIIRRLKQRGIETTAQESPALHQQIFYQSVGYLEGDSLVAEKDTRDFIGLPVSARFSDDKVAYHIHAHTQIGDQKDIVS